VPLLLKQVEAFSCLPLADLIFTHLDEEARTGKLWNLVLETNVAIGFLSAGQNVPGDFRAASAELLLPRQWP
jgi:flagellar biosynthesis GTPase FlhF